MEKDLDQLRVQQGIMGEKIACNVFVKRGRFSGFCVGTYAPFDMVVDTNRNVQIKTLIPYVKHEAWTINGRSQVAHLLEAEEAYIISVPANLDSIPGKEHLWKYQGKMLRVNMQRLRQQNSQDSLSIPMTDEYVDLYDNLDDEACMSLLKYPVSSFAMKPQEWKQRSENKSIK
jgi:hypothetical protein